MFIKVMALLNFIFSNSFEKTRPATSDISSNNMTLLSLLTLFLSLWIELKYCVRLFFLTDCHSKQVWVVKLWVHLWRSYTNFILVFQLRYTCTAMFPMGFQDKNVMVVHKYPEWYPEYPEWYPEWWRSGNDNNLT